MNSCMLLQNSSHTETQHLYPLQVDEGVEAMLCCWLQHLQEFGGPELNKPDLLKGSRSSLRSHSQAKRASSSNSLPRNLLMETKARYNVSTFGTKTSSDTIKAILNNSYLFNYFWHLWFFRPFWWP
jgi:hypothetical protein